MVLDWVYLLAPSETGITRDHTSHGSRFPRCTVLRQPSKGTLLAESLVWRRPERLQALHTLWVTLQQGDGLLRRACAVKVAKQQGEYIAKLLASGKAQPGQPIQQGVKPFR